VLIVITKAGESRAKKNDGKRCRNGQAPWSVVCGWDFRKSGYGQYVATNYQRTFTHCLIGLVKLESEPY
jgi:hypothetical protein